MVELSFNVSRFSCSIELDVLVVGFLKESGDYLIFQQGLTKDAGMCEPPYFEFNDQLYGGYGLVKSCVATRSHVIIELSQSLNGVSKFIVGLAELQTDYQEIIDQLRKIFVSNEEVFSTEIS